MLAMGGATGNGAMRHGGDFAIYSVKWSGDGREIIAGTNDEGVSPAMQFELGQACGMSNIS